MPEINDLPPVPSVQATDVFPVDQGATTYKESVSQITDYLSANLELDTTSQVTGLDTALSNKQPLDAGLTSISGLTTAADKMIYTTAPDTYATTTLSAAARNVLDDTTTAQMLSTLGAVPLAGGTMTGALTLNADPSAPLGAATKQYVDNMSPGAGNVVGPASSTTDCIATYANTTGRLLKNTTVTVNSSGDIGFGGQGGDVNGILQTTVSEVYLTSTAPNANITLKPTGIGAATMEGDFVALGNCTLSNGFSVPQGGTLDITPLALPGDPASIGIATLSNGSVTVQSSNVTSSSIIFVSYNTVSGTPGILKVATGNIVDGISFQIDSNAGDNSTVNWIIFN